MEKVKVSAALAKAIESALRVGNETTLLKDQMKNKWSLSEYLPLNNISVMQLAEILVKGYEVEFSKEEEVLKVWDRHKPDMEDYEYCRGWKNGVTYILSKYDIKIEGINK